MKIGLVLSGGIAKGAYQIGVLKAFQKYLPPDFFSCISASSVGTLNGYAYHIGILEKAEKIWTELNFAGIYKFSCEIYKEKFLLNLFNLFLKNKENHNIDFFVTLFSISDYSLNYVNLKNHSIKNRAKLLISSVSFPPFSKPITINNNKFIDGAMIDNIPIHPIVDKDLDFVIVVYFDDENYIFESTNFNKKVIRINFLESKLIKDSFDFNTNSISNMIELGEKAALEIINEYQLKMPNKDYIHKKILENKKNKKPKIRISGDSFVDSTNKLLKRIIKTKTNIDNKNQKLELKVIGDSI